MRFPNTGAKLLLPLVLLMTAAAASGRAELSLKDLKGKRARLDDYRGKIVVLNFWATWCGPCKDEMPRLVEAEKEYSGRGVVFVAASLDDKKAHDKIAVFVNEHQVGFPIWVGATTDDLDRLGMGPGLPATAFVDEQGNVVARVLGEVRQQELAERLDWLVRGRTGAQPAVLVNHLGDK
ncbi:MAG TPA: TlpA disulfide reductase family protein [Terriglobales bacterium]|jgi:thiol-disulfide isomerase/thioredoxin|nr:TlpA disulfide reductase family protein [Terriglobales bacterium]